jgi:hypothetical protein
MNNTEMVREKQSIFFNTFSWIFSIIFLAIGIINTFWGNDAGYGVLIILLSFVFYPPVNGLIKEKLGFAIPVLLKIVIGLFIIWTAIGVGELFGKIDLMLMDLK